MQTTNKLEKLFTNKDLLKLALTHKSWINEHENGKVTNERLEYLGDAVLELAVSEELYLRFPDKEEGFLTTLRSNLVNTTNLTKIAKKLKLGELLLLAKGEEETGGRNNPSLLANTTEAVIGALYLDQGMEKTRKFIETHLFSDIDKKIKKPLKDPKSRLQEYAQNKGFHAPSYKVVSQTGPDHDKTFVINVFVNDKVWGKGKGESKSKAAQKAAKDALTKHLEKSS